MVLVSVSAVIGVGGRVRVFDLEDPKDLKDPKDIKDIFNRHETGKTPTRPK